MRDTLLVIAAGPLQVPAIEEASAMGLKTVAVDVNPHAVGMARAHAAYPIDIFDVDAISAIGRKEKVTGVMTLCTDAPARTVAAVARALGLPALSPDAAAHATDKRRMRSVLQQHAVPIPDYCEVESLDDALRAAQRIGFPVALKIPCSSGSRGIYRVSRSEQLAEYFALARGLHREGSLLIEAWLTGPEVSVEGVCCGGKVTVVQVTDKLLFGGPYPVEAGHTQPTRLPAEAEELIRTVTEAAVLALGIDESAFHAELKLTDAGPMVIEVGPRLGGDRIATHLVPLSTGVNLVRAAIQLAVGQVPDLVPKWQRGAAIRYFHAPAAGVIEQVGGLERIQAMEGLELLYAASERDGALAPGLRIHEIHSSLDRYGHVIFSGRDARQASERAEQAVARLTFQLREAEVVGR